MSSLIHSSSKFIRLYVYKGGHQSLWDMFPIRAGRGGVGPGGRHTLKNLCLLPPPPKLHFHWKIFAINRKNANILGMCISLIFHNEKSIFCFHAQKLKECLKVYQISKIIILLNGKDKTGRRNGNYFFVSFFSNNFNISLKHLEKF